jgi:hypothetical protein
LWFGNGRAGRSFHDLKDLLSGSAIEVPANEQVLKLILADDATFEAAILKILSNRSEQKEERFSPQSSMDSDGLVLRTRP